MSCCGPSTHPIDCHVCVRGSVEHSKRRWQQSSSYSHNGQRSEDQHLFQDSDYEEIKLRKITDQKERSKNVRYAIVKDRTQTNVCW